MGLTAPALYRYFNDRMAILDELWQQVQAEIAEATAASADAVPDDPVEECKARLRALRGWLRQHPAEARLALTPTRGAGSLVLECLLAVLGELHARVFPEADLDQDLAAAWARVPGLYGALCLEALGKQGKAELFEAFVTDLPGPDWLP